MTRSSRRRKKAVSSLPSPSSPSPTSLSSSSAHPYAAHIPAYRRSQNHSSTINSLLTPLTIRPNIQNNSEADTNQSCSESTIEVSKRDNNDKVSQEGVVEGNKKGEICVVIDLEKKTSPPKDGDRMLLKKISEEIYKHFQEYPVLQDREISNKIIMEVIAAFQQSCKDHSQAQRPNIIINVKADINQNINKGNNNNIVQYGGIISDSKATTSTKNEILTPLYYSDFVISRLRILRYMILLNIKKVGMYPIDQECAQQFSYLKLNKKDFINYIPCIDYLNLLTSDSRAYNYRINVMRDSENMCEAWFNSGEIQKLRQYLQRRILTYYCYIKRKHGSENNWKSSQHLEPYFSMPFEPQWRKFCKLPTFSETFKSLKLDSLRIHSLNNLIKEQNVIDAASKKERIGTTFKFKVSEEIRNLTDAVLTKQTVEDVEEFADIENIIKESRNSICYQFSALEAKRVIESVKNFGKNLELDRIDRTMVKILEENFQILFGGGMAKVDDNESLLKTYILHNPLDDGEEEDHDNPPSDQNVPSASSLL